MDTGYVLTWFAASATVGLCFACAFGPTAGAIVALAVHVLSLILAKSEEAGRL